MRLRFWLWVDALAFRHITAIYPEGWWRSYPSGEIQVGKRAIVNGASKMADSHRVAAMREP